MIKRTAVFTFSVDYEIEKDSLDTREEFFIAFKEFSNSFKNNDTNIVDFYFEDRKY